MNELVEIEYKILLNKDMFYRILNDYQNQISRTYTQTNYYLTYDLLKQRKYMLRIREKEDSYEMTLKRPYMNHRLETNVDITKEDKENILNGKMIDNEIISILKQEGFDISLIQNEVSLTTKRHDIYLDEGVLSLDINTYNGITDYELEFEVTDEKLGYYKFLEILQPYHLFYVRNNKSKVKRALDSI